MGKKEVAAKPQRGVSRTMARPVVTLPKEVKRVLATIRSKEARNAYKHAMLDAIYAAEVFLRTSGKKKDVVDTAGAPATE